MFESFTLCGKRFTMVSIQAKAEIWPGLLKYQIVQMGPNTMEVRGVCVADANPDSVLSSLAERLQQYFRENGCEGAVFIYSTEPLLYNAQGGKIPRYIRK